MTQKEFQKRYTYNPVADCLGEGGFGKVYKAYDTYRDRYVAVKVSDVKPGYESIRLKNETELINKLPVHPNIAYYEECYTFATPMGEYDFGVLQYYDEGNLLDLLKSKKMTVEQKYGTLRQLLDGICFLHKHNIIHRDLKPQNILIVKRGGEYIPKITDFGISKKVENNKDNSIFNNSLAGAGTLSYASPEQLKAGTIRKNTDLWSFGVMAFQMLTGELPFSTSPSSAGSEAGRVELFKKISAGTLPESINKVEQPWQDLIRKCLINDSELRVKDCETCLVILNGEEIQDEETALLEEKNTIITKPPKTNDEKKKKMLILISSLCGILIVIGLILFFSMKRPKIEPSAEQIVTADTILQENPDSIQTEILPITIVEEEKPEEKIIIAEQKPTEEKPRNQPEKPVQQTSLNIGGNKYSGNTKNGKPNGNGILYYSKATEIEINAMGETIITEIGDYLEGRWQNGELEHGILYDKNKNKKQAIIIGRF